MDYKSLDDAPYYKECASLVEGLAYRLVSLKIEGGGRVCAVVAAPAGAAMSVDECAKVHRALLPRMESLTGRGDLSMELSSPGIERNIKNAAEFEIFTGYGVRLFVRRGEEEGGQWISGKIIGADETAVTIMSIEGERLVLYSDISKAKLTDEKASAPLLDRAGAREVFLASDSEATPTSTVEQPTEGRVAQGGSNV